MKKIILITMLLLANTAFALDATRMSPGEFEFTPSDNTVLLEIKRTAEDALGIANEAVGIARGTRATLVNQNGCVYNDHFNCTEETLTYEYRTTNHSMSWTTHGNDTWTVPRGVTSVNINVTGGARRIVCFGDCDEQISSSENRCIAGGKASFNRIVANGGTCSNYGRSLGIRRQSSQRNMQVRQGQRFLVKISQSGLYQGVKGRYGSVTITYAANIRL